MAKRKAAPLGWQAGSYVSMGGKTITIVPTTKVKRDWAAEQPRTDVNWTPPEFPNLEGDREIELNYESTGLDWRGADVPIGASIHCGGKTWYLPWGHKGGGNIEDGLRKFQEWGRTNLAGKRITNSNTRFDAHMSRKIGLDLDELGCELSDVQHYAGLLNDHRKQFNVGVLIREYLDETPMDRVDESRMADYHAGQVAPRSEYGVRKIRELRDKMWPLMDAEELQEVRQLEDDCIHAVVEMEENGAPIDVGLLEQWQVQIQKEIAQLRDEVSRAVGIATQDSLFGGDEPISFFNPDSGKDMEMLFTRLGLPVERTETGRGRFNADAMLQYHNHPVLSKIVRQGKLLDLESKYIHPYLAHVNGQNILRYELHQMRGDENGTVRGRFASARVNIQQVLKPNKQAKNYGPGYVVRSLFLPAPGRIFVSGDAEQIEYRIFAHYANNLRVFAEYAKNPWLNFHKLTEAMICKLGFDIDYDKAKQLNFLTIYGGGLLKLALQLGTISGAQHRELTLKYGDRDKYPFGPPREHPYLRDTVRVQQAYRKALPEARALSRKCTDVAKDRGYVKDFKGRRARFPGGHGAHGALNAVIQPGAAEVMKRKMVEVHRKRREIGVTPRMTIHDDWLGDCADDDSARRLQNLLNEQSFSFKVPILWNVKRGPRWSECKDLDKEAPKAKEDQFAGTVGDITRSGRDRT